MNKIVSFINEIKIELFKTTWPSRNEVVGAMIIVCILTAVFAVILGFMDFAFSYIIKSLAF